MKKVYIVCAKRTAIGSFGGSLSNINVSKIGAAAIQGLFAENENLKNYVDEVYMGNVLQAGVGQAPARQAAIFAGLSENIPCTTVNKVCASGMKSVQLAAQSIKAGENNLVVAGGMENMSKVPHYFDGRRATKLGSITVTDGLILDGLTDVYNNSHMGVAAELCATRHNITREEQDEFAISSYKRSAKAWDEGKMQKEITPINIPQRRGEDIIFNKDEEFENVKFEKIPQLRTVFQEEGTVTAANASTLNDGAAALLLASEEAVAKHQLTPIAEVVSYADAAKKPEEFTTAPADALPLALNKARLHNDQIDFWELNEAFSVVGIANCQLLKLPQEKVNVYGGAVSLGHPLGCSGARILVTLINVLQQENGTYGAAGICNGGGGASAMIIKKVES